MARAIFISGPAGAGKTSVAAELSRLLDCPIVEVDDVKEKRHGTTEVSDAEDFTEAGRRSKKALGEYGQAIVVEAFAGEAFVELVRRELPHGTALMHVYLWCDPAEAVQRKKGILTSSVVQQQFQRFPGPTYPGRTPIDTTKRSVADVTAEIISNLGSAASG